jgi:hypothetical protein
MNNNKLLAAQLLMEAADLLTESSDNKTIKWNAKPLESVNNIKFGTDRNQVQKLMGRNFTEFKKTKSSTQKTDDYGICHIYYDKENKFCAMEIFNDVNIVINGKVIFPTEIDIVKKIIPDLVQDDDNYYISKSKSISIYAPSDIMDSILIGNKNYLK